MEDYISQLQLMKDWPARLSDLTSLPYLLWNHRKTEVYRTSVNTRDEEMDLV